jgi:hypothetical protein
VKVTWRIAALGIVLLSLPANYPLFTAPFFTSDDGWFHLYRLAALDDAIRHGVVYPRLFPSFAFGYGQAVFSYYGPLVYYIAEVFHLLGADFPLAIKLTFALGYICSGWTLYAFARQHVNPLPALAAAVAYVYFPYHLAETYQRGALAEHWAFVWLPLTLFQIYSRHTFVVVSSFAALILTHSLTALIFLPFVIIYHLLIHKPQATPTPYLQSPISNLQSLISNLLLAFLLTTFYWLPIAAQSRWVGLSAGLDHDGYRFHLAPPLSFVQPSLIFQYAPNQIVVADHPLGLWSSMILLMASAMLVWLWRRRHTLTPGLAFFLAMTLSALFMASEPSQFIWQWLHNPLTFLQYPWRFLTLAALGISMCLALIMESITPSSPLHLFTPSPPHPLSLISPFPRLLIYSLTIFSLILTATLALPIRPLAAAPSATHAMWQNDYQHKQIGATWTAEYMPWWVRADRTAIPNARHAPGSEVMATFTPQLTLSAAGYTLRRYTLAPTPQASVLRFHQFYLPQWRVWLAGQPLATFPSTELGLLSIALPPITQPTTLTMDFALTNLERVAIIISITSLPIVVWFWRKHGRRLVVTFLVALALLTLRPSDPATLRPLDQPTTFEDFADLIGVSLPSGAQRAGDTVQVTLTWLVRRETRENFKGFVHLMSADGARLVAQSDGDPVGGFTPTSQWRVGEIVEDTRFIHVPPNTPAGTLPLFTGLYRTQPLKNLSATQAPDGRIRIGELVIGNW